jgi:hypothetical protein
VAEVSASLRLGGIKRGVQADGDERVLERRPRTCVRMNVARRHTRHSEPLRETGQAPVASTVVAQEGTLQLDPQPLGAERIAQAPERELIVHASLGASAEADQTFCVVEHLVEGDEGL